VEPQLLISLDRLAVGTVWKGPRGGDSFKKISDYSHLNIRTGELVFDKRLYGHDAEPLYVSEAKA
jgi:hypothetical protein